MDTFAEIADERRTLAGQLAQLTPGQQNSPSLCAGWRVHDVAAHLIMPLEVSMPRFAWAMLTAAGNFDRANQRLTSAVARRPFGEIVQVLRTKADSRFTPPGEGPAAPLTDIVVHGLDVRRPLRLPYRIPDQRLRAVLTAVMQAPSAVVTKGSLAGLRFEATDLDFASGDGPVLSGPADALLLAIAGRSVALDSLTGDGVPILRSRS